MKKIKRAQLPFSSRSTILGKYKSKSVISHLFGNGKKPHRNNSVLSKLKMEKKSSTISKLKEKYSLIQCRRNINTRSVFRANKDVREGKSVKHRSFSQSEKGKKKSISQKLIDSSLKIGKSTTAMKGYSEGLFKLKAQSSS